ncbi:MAG: prepilin-type N-terminal cleavage/methylation domain-containing protein [Opitutaceae bacterium]
MISLDRPYPYANRAGVFGLSWHRADRGIAGSQRRSGFTLLEILLALALVSLMLVSLNTFVFSMGELWGKNSDVRLFDQHVRNVTRFLERELRSAVLPPAARVGATPIAGQEIRPASGMSDTLLTFELPSGSRLLVWPEQPLPEVVCSLQAREREGLIMLWHSRLEKNFDTDPPRETVVTPLVTSLAYDYYDPNFKRWTTEANLRKDTGGSVLPPQRLRLKFAYSKMTKETVIALVSTLEGLPGF